jgi:murein DD-endopeptidase MepM/ murein hydrolase activator NlpD
MSLISAPLRSWMCALGVVLIGVAAAGCSVEPDRFDDNRWRGHFETNGFQSGPRFASSNYRPPLPIPGAPSMVAAALEAPSTVATAVAAPPVGYHDGVEGDDAAATTGSLGAHVVAPGTTIKISERDARSLPEVAATNVISQRTKPDRGDQVMLRRGSRTNVQRNSEPVGGEQPSVPPVEGAAAAVPAPDTPASVDPSKAAEAAPKFRWPVRGQVIAGFGSKIKGRPNNGINVAVPEDTSIKAAEGGVVVYSGNELKAYGNLLLVRHPNGYVTAYAHAKQLLVKGGDEIKRGQVIAKSGRTGDVDTPQLHFEIRKASAPVDPMQYLSGA